MVNGDATETSLAERSVNNTRADLNSTQVNETPTKVSHHVLTSFLLAMLCFLAKVQMRLISVLIKQLKLLDY